MADAVSFAVALVPIVALGFADGGYFPEAWAWATLGFSWLAIVAALLVRDRRVSRHALILLALLAAIGVWVAASMLWTRSLSLTVPELQRLLVYVTGVCAATLVVGDRRWRPLVGGVFVGCTAVVLWGLVDYLVTREAPPVAFEHKLLYEPMGYANAMGITAVLAIALALGLVVASEQCVARIGGSALLVPLAAALALTGSRGAWLALFAGVGVAIGLSSERWRVAVTILAVSIVPAVAVAAIAATNATSTDIAGARADRLGERLLVAVIALTMVSVAPAWLLARAGGPRASRSRWLLACLATSAIVLLSVGVALEKPGVVGDRPTYWRAALAELTEHPVLGTGAGTYPQVWLERRTNETSVRDAHSIVVEWFAELGPVGLILVATLLAVPVMWGFSARRTRYAAWVAGAFAAFAVHAAIDWDWEMPAVTLAALFCAVALAVAADADRAATVVSQAQRRLVIAVGAVAAAVAFLGALGARALTDAGEALRRGDAVTAERKAQRAESLLPWSVEPLLVRGQAALAVEDRDFARAVFRRAVERDPNDYRAWLALAAVSDAEEAELALLRAQALNPGAVQRT